MMLKRDIDTKIIQLKLNIYHDELKNMIKRLSEMELLQYISFYTIEITETGICFINKKDKEE